MMPTAKMMKTLNNAMKLTQNNKKHRPVN